jgi:hypothetical protein
MLRSRELAHSLRLSVLAVFASVILGCAAQDRDYPEFRAELADLKARTIPAGGRITETSAIRRSPGALEATWTIDTGMPWNEYSAWLAKSMRAGWAEPGPNAAPANDALVFNRSLTNELFLLQTKRISGHEARVHVSFRVVAH